MPATLDDFDPVKRADGRYELLGSGGYGVIVKARHRGEGWYAALKLVFSVSRTELEECENERVLEGIAHPNIVKLHHFERRTSDALTQRWERGVRESLSGLDDKFKSPPHFERRGRRGDVHSLCAFVFDICDGPCLIDHFLDHGGRMSDEGTRPLFRQLMLALAGCHDKGIAHCDVKLDNVMLHDGERELKLIDFGLATRERYFHGPDARGSQTYMAPEMRKRGTHDLFKSDVFSAGVTLFIMMSGSMPWTCTSTSSHNYCRHWHHFSNCCERLRRDDPKKGPVAAHLAFLMGSEQAAKFVATVDVRLLELLDLMLCPDPTQRSTVANVLSHPWVTEGQKPAADKKPAEASLAQKFVETVSKVLSAVENPLQENPEMALCSATTSSKGLCDVTNTKLEVAKTKLVVDEPCLEHFGPPCSPKSVTAF